MIKLKIWKKVIFGIWIGSTILLTTACGSKIENYYELGVINTDTSQTNFTIMGGISALSSGYENNEILNQMQENAGIEIEWNVMSDSLTEQVNIRIAGRKLPDAFMAVGFNNYDITTYGSDGAFIDLSPYLTDEYMPNLSKILKENPDIKSAITMSDGGIYGLPSGEQMGTFGIGAKEDYNIYQFPQFAMINKAWLEELNLEMPTTLDELHDVLVAFEENDMATYYGNEKGSTIPMSTGFDQWCWGQNIFYAGFGFTNWPNDVINDLELNEDGTVHFICADKKYRDALTYFHNWYKEGLMDIEMFSQDDKQLMAKCQQGKVGVGTWWWFDLWGEHKEDYVYLPVLDGPDGTHNLTLRSAPPLSCGNLSITSACKSPINLLKFFDQWYNPENVMQLQYGPIGTYFTGQDEEGVWQSISDEDAQRKYGKSAAELKGVNEVYGPKLILSDYYGSTFALEDAAVIRLTDLYEIWMPYVEKKIAYPTDCVFTEEELDVIDRYKADFESAVAEQEGLWIKEGGPTDNEWDIYLKKLKEACGMEELQKVYQDAYNRYMEAR